MSKVFSKKRVYGFFKQTKIPRSREGFPKIFIL